MVSFPNCKINLGLNIVAKRKDGYHDIETCFYPVPWCDVLEVIPSKAISFSNSGLSITGKPKDNLCFKAYCLLADEYKLPAVAMHLHKNVPIGAGLGGGSSDAAFMIKILNELFDLQLAVDDQVSLAANLGSDCPFFIHDTPMIGEGRGDKLTPVEVDLKSHHLVIIKPDIHVGTADAYQNIKPHIPENSITSILENQNIQSWRELIVNDFELSVFEKYPIIRKIRDDLYKHGAQYASMSGSGSSVFGIFDTPVNLEENYKSMTYWSGAL